MLTENGKNALPEPIVKRLDEINTLCLETMGKRIKEFGGLSPSDAHKLARQLKLGADIRMIERELAKATSKSLEDIETILNIVANDNVETSKTMLEAKGTFIPFSENKELQNWVSALAKQSQQELINLAKTTAFMRYDEKGNKVLSSLSETYNAVIDKAVASASSGVVDYKTAMRKTLKDLADSGLRTKYKKLEGSAGPTVDYASGYSRRLDTAVRQNILWGIKECNLGIQEQIGEEFSADGYEIDYHRNPRPSHAEMGGKQYVKGKARYIKGKYYESFEVKAEPLLAEYGCLHFKFPIICGISRPIYSDEELARFKAMDNKTFEYEGKTYTGYEAKQMQRKLETAIRHAKDRQKIAKAAGDDTLRRQEQKKLNDLTRKYKDFSEKAGLSVKKDRMSVSGYYRVKPVDNGGGSGIMKASGRGAKSSTSPVYQNSFCHKIGTIDFNDKNAVIEYMEKFENKFAHKDREYCLVITETGDVYVARGKTTDIDTDKIFGDKMKNSWNTHTHPPDQTEYSFSTRDIFGAALDGTAVMRASDTKYCYEIRFNEKKFSEDEITEAIEISEDLKYDNYDAKGYIMSDYAEKIKHSVIEDICEMLGVEYKRWKK